MALNGGVVMVRGDVNTRFYGEEVAAADLFSGAVPPPEAAAVLYEKIEAYEAWAGLSRPAAALAPEGL